MHRPTMMMTHMITMKLMLHGNAPGLCSLAAYVKVHKPIYANTKASAAVPVIEMTTLLTTFPYGDRLNHV